MQSPTPLSQAIVSGDDDAVKSLISAGVDVNSRSASGQTPLILAVASGQTHIIPLLIDAGAQPHLRDKLDLNAIDWAERKGLGEVKVLLEGGAGPPVAPKVNQRPDGKRSKMTPTTSTTPGNQSTSEVDPSEEKARKWISGLRARFEEKAQRENSASTINKSTSNPDVLPQTVADNGEVSAHTVAVNEPEILTEDVETSSVSALTTHVFDDIEPPRKSSRKRCPKCNAMYDSELLGYCAHHVVQLVDADSPVVVGPPREIPSWLWLVLMVTLCAAIVGGYYYLISRTNPVSTLGSVVASPSQPATVRKAPAMPSVELAGKAKSLPDAECPAKDNESAAGTVIVRVKIDKSGRVFWTRSSGGDSLLRAAAMDAAYKATFIPATLGSNTVEGSLTYNFKP